MSTAHDRSNVSTALFPVNMQDSELVEEHLSVIIGRGSKSSTSRKKATKIISAYGAHRIPSLVADDYLILGLSKNTADILVSAILLTKRATVIANKYKTIRISSPADVGSIYGPQMRDLQNEVFKVITLRTDNSIITDNIVSSGGISASIVESRMVFKRAIADHAASIICVHNHPSGNPEPSRQDIAVAKQLVEAGKIMGIPIRDFMIIAGNTFTSLAERGFIN